MDEPLRAATLDDLPALAALETTCFGDEAYTLLQLRQWLDLSGPLLRVAPWADGPLPIAGYGLGHVGWDGTGWILALGVHPEARGRALGRRLTQDTLDALAARGVTETRLTTHPDNAPALRIYRALGFDEGALHPDYYGPGEPRWLLRRR